MFKLYEPLSPLYQWKHWTKKKEKSNPGSWTRGLTWPSCSVLKPAPICPCPHASGSPTFLAFCEGWTGALQSPSVMAVLPCLPMAPGLVGGKAGLGQGPCQEPRCFPNRKSMLYQEIALILPWILKTADQVTVTNFPSKFCCSLQNIVIIKCVLSP